MPYYAALIPPHGIKTCHARNASEAARIFTGRTTGTAPLWVAPYPATYAPIIGRLAKLGFTPRDSATFLREVGRMAAEDDLRA